MRISEKEEGVALLAVLALVLLLSGLAALGLAALKAGVEEASAGEARAQSLFLTRSAEEMALALAAQQQKARKLQANPKALQETKLTLAGARLDIRLMEGGACFNLNSLAAKPKGEAFEQTPAADSSKFGRLLTAAGFDPLQATALARATAAYLTQGILLADASEWLEVPGAGKKEWDRLKPLLCALPTREAAQFSVNDLTPEKAPLLAAMGLGPDEARRAVAARPRDGWQDMQQFWEEASPRGMPEGGEILTTKGRWLEARISVQAPQFHTVRTLLVDMAKTPPTAADERWLLTETRK